MIAGSPFAVDFYVGNYTKNFTGNKGAIIKWDSLTQPCLIRPWPKWTLTCRDYLCVRPYLCVCVTTWYLCLSVQTELCDLTTPFLTDPFPPMFWIKWLSFCHWYTVCSLLSHSVYVLVLSCGLSRRPTLMQQTMQIFTNSLPPQNVEGESWGNLKIPIPSMIHV